MAFTITGSQIVREVVRRGGLGLYIENAEASVAAGALTSVLHFRNGQHSPNHWRSLNAGIWRPSNATGIADQWRVVGDLTPSTGALAVDAVWADTTGTGEDYILLKHGITPMELVQAMNTATAKVYFTNSEPLSTKPVGTTIADAGFQSNLTTAYALGSSGSFSKVSTANSEFVFPGYIASGLLDSAGAGDYIYQRYAVNEGEMIHDFMLTALAAGVEVEHGLYDVTGSALIGETITHSQQQWQWTKRVETVPEDCKVIEWRGGGSGASDDVYFNAHCFYRTRALRLILDTKWDTEFKAPSLAYVKMGGQSVAPGVYDAMSAEVLPIPKEDYTFVSERAGANPYAIQFHVTPTNPNGTHWFNYPIIIQGRRAHADVDGPFELDLDQTTSADLDLIVWATLKELFENPSILTRVPQAAVTLTKATEEFNKTKDQFKYAPAAKEKHVIKVWGLGN